MVYKKITCVDAQKARRKKRKILKAAVILTSLVGATALVVSIPAPPPDPEYSFTSIVYGSGTEGHYYVEDDSVDNSDLYTIGVGDYSEGDKVRVTMEYGQIADVEKIGGESVCH